MNNLDRVDQETAALFGGEAAEIRQDDDALEVQLALRTLRDHLLAVADRNHVGVNQLARRLHISPSAVSRLFNGDGDIRVSTAVLYARALGSRWDFLLRPDAACVASGNQSTRPEILQGGSHSATTSRSTPPMYATNIPDGVTVSSELKLAIQATA